MKVKYLERFYVAGITVKTNNKNYKIGDNITITITSLGSSTINIVTRQ